MLDAGLSSLSLKAYTYDNWFYKAAETLKNTPSLH